MVLTIGSGDIAYLMMGKDTKGYQQLLQRFVAENRPYWNSFASPIDALRTGAILEYNYLSHLPDNYIFQKKVQCEEMDVFVASIDFAKIDNGEIVDFDELKTIFLPDYLELIMPFADQPEEIYLPMLKKKFKKNYEQIQDQLMCADLDSANLVFMSVMSYDDEENQLRAITPKDYTKFRIHRDESVISEIKEKGRFFQDIKDHFSEKEKSKSKKTKEAFKKIQEIVNEPIASIPEETPQIDPKPIENTITQNLLETEIDI